jgi:aldehyde dehydrogenase (NAD+)
MPIELAPPAAARDSLLGNFIAGSWSNDGTDERVADLDPASGEPLIEVVRSPSRLATEALAVAAEAQQHWRRRSPLERASVISSAASLLRERSEQIAETMSREEGKPLPEARGEVGRAAEVLDVVAGYAHKPTGEVFPRRRQEQWLLTLSSPLGVVVVIAPWNFPLLIPAWKVAPALLAGNSVVLKPAETTPLTAAHLVQAFADAGLPPGALNLVLGRGSELGPALLQAPATAVSFTGSNNTGRELASRAVEQHMKFQLELGGSNPVLVLADADLDLTVREVVAGATSSSGQKCTATRRVYVEEGVVENFTEQLRAALAPLRLGPGIDAATDVGPLVSSEAKADFDGAVAEVEKVADVHAFGTQPEQGFFVRPRLALGGDPDHPLFREEIFGPMAALFAVADFEEGIARCNDTPFGLSASLFSSNLTHALAFADGIDAGMIHVNSQTTGAEPHIPFGGFKQSSSFSRELGRHGIEFFSQVKTVYLEGT